MSVSIKYKGAEIASASTEVTKTIKTAGKYCEADILVINTPDGGDAPVINPLSVTANGTYTAPSGVDGYSPVTVNVPQGITPTGNINITDTNVTDVTNYATAQVSSDTLLSENIKKNVNILGIVGSFEGGAQGYYATSGGYAYYTDIMNFPATLPKLQGCSHIKELHAPYHTTGLDNSQLRGLTEMTLFDVPNITAINYQGLYNARSLTSLFLPKCTNYSGYNAIGNAISLKTAELGSIGKPVTNISTTCFNEATQADLTITVYVNASSLAEAQAISNVGTTAPWGATNATIVYKSSTTGEVLT